MIEKVVSVIIPAYNAEKYLEETVKSVLNSSYKSIEIILMDDGSTDKTGEIADSLTKTYLNISSYHQVNKGVSAARNEAIKLSSGKYILPLDADDLISIDYIEKAVTVLENNPDVKVVYGCAQFFGDKFGKWQLPDYDINLLARRNIIYVSGVYRRNDYDNTSGYCEEIAGLEDWDFWISMLKTGGKVSYIDTECFYYRITQDSKRSKDSKKKKQIIDMLNVRHKEFFKNHLGGKLHYNRSWSRFLNALNIKRF
ncbi:MAG: glycosyltransferase family A protein [Dysgonamonadaceae bacterium]|jgi:glycosyltransferase involved in cell wall biosynthesis|nr:glycosyltransferase family A protein [Dysgonamonadaceae bacterium]MEA5082062.1 glycosyltransferase family A protein [Dysgonamonadaceae bacterium]